jgi:hypothetical protein
VFFTRILTALLTELDSDGKNAFIAGSRFPLLLHQLAKARQNELAVLLDLLVGEARESVEKYSGGSFSVFGAVARAV